jgi:chromosome segregation ATPase
MLHKNIYSEIKRSKNVSSIKKYIIVFFVGVIVGAASVFFIQQASYNKQLVEYRNTITELGITIEGLRATNKQLEDSNTRIGQELTESRRRVKETEGIIDSVGEGLSNASGEISGIIAAIRKVRKAIEQYEPESTE